MNVLMDVGVKIDGCSRNRVPPCWTVKTIKKAKSNGRRG